MPTGVYDRPLLSEAVRACDYTPDPVTIPPTIEVRI